ncbi:hypothetical protein STEG23_007050, partial [Scotinomys teguina]
LIYGQKDLCLLQWSDVLNALLGLGFSHSPARSPLAQADLKPTNVVKSAWLFSKLALNSGPFGLSLLSAGDTNVLCDSQLPISMVCAWS